MKLRLIKYVVLVLLFCINNVESRLSLTQQDIRRPFDQDLYESVLDSDACRAQVRNISRNNTLLLLRFLDAGIRLPKGILERNLNDLGNYYQCLGIDEELDDNMRVEGKYCTIRVPADQQIRWPDLPRGSLWHDQNWKLDEKSQEEIEFFRSVATQSRVAAGFEDYESVPTNILAGMVFRLAVCIPKPCTTEEAITSLLFNITELGFRYQDEFCRLPNDKPWVAADTVAVVVFSLIGFLTIMSTCYDLNHTLILKRDPKSTNAIYASFSVYTNARRLLTFTSNKGTLECLDGIRVLSMMWIIMGHAFAMFPFTWNWVEFVSWMSTVEALWITTAPISVDTFFMIAGVLMVYTTAGKMTGWQLLKRLHLFYLNRLLRMFPALAAIVLLEASVFHRIADGPLWNAVARNAQRCRSYWWATLLHVQNWINTTAMCIPHSWYIAIDVQLYFVSPIVLFWVLNGCKKSAWTALAAGLLGILTASTIYCFLMELPAGTVAFSRSHEFQDFMKYYYFNTLTRGPPFFVGMVVGYMLHVCRGKKVKMPLILVLLLWICSLGTFALPFYTTYLIKQFDWDNQIVDSLINSYQRSVWGVGLGWMIFACVQGYGGPINWFLSLQIWKLPSRLSYSMYLYHYSLMFITGDMKLSPNYFSIPSMMYNFLGQFTLTMIVSFAIAVLIESPFAILFRFMLESGKKKPKAGIENGAVDKNLS